MMDKKDQDSSTIALRPLPLGSGVMEEEDSHVFEEMPTSTTVQTARLRSPEPTRIMQRSGRAFDHINLSQEDSSTAPCDIEWVRALETTPFHISNLADDNDDDETSFDLESNQHALTEAVQTLTRRGGRPCRYSAVPRERVVLEHSAAENVEEYKHSPRSPLSSVQHHRQEFKRKWIRQARVALCWFVVLWFALRSALHCGALRPKMSQPKFVRESIMMLDMLLCKRRAIHSGMYDGGLDKNLTSEFKIPFTLYQSWMRRDVSNFRFNDIAVFFEHNPQWTYRLFADDSPNASETIDGWVDEHITSVLEHTELDDENVDVLDARILGPHFTTVEQNERIACAYSMLQGGASKVDLWRYLIIYHEGGLYVDFDAVLSDAYMDEILGMNDTFVTSVRDEVEMDQYFILAAKHHPILARAVNQTTEAILKMAYLHDVAEGNSTTFLFMACKEILSKWKTHAMYPLDSDFGAHSRNADELHAVVNATPYPRRYCTCHNLDNQMPFTYMDQLHAACMTGPNVWKAAFEWALYDDAQASHLKGIHIFPSEGLSGRLPPKFVKTRESVWHSNRIEKVKDAGAITQAWPSMGEHFIDFDNDCWKQFDLSFDWFPSDGAAFLKPFL